MKRVLVPVILLDSIIAIAVEQPPQPSPVLALGWVPLELYRDGSWGAQVQTTRRKSWRVDHFMFGFIPVLVPGGCMTSSTNAPTIDLVGRAALERRLRFR